MDTDLLFSNNKIFNQVHHTLPNLASVVSKVVGRQGWAENQRGRLSALQSVYMQ